MPLVRYYWATFCHSSNLEASLHHLFSPPTPLFPPLQLIARFVSLFSHFRVNSFTLLSRNNNTNSAISGENLGHKSTRKLGTNQREIWAQINGVRPTGSDRLTSGARTAISETTNDRFVCRRFLAGEITGSFLCHASSLSAI